MKVIVSLIGLLFLSMSLHAQLKLPALVSDSMILQRDQPVKIWGWSLNGETVTVHFNKKTYTAKPANDNKWMITLPATKAGGPYTIQVTSGSNEVQVKDVLFGDVWLCSGQSNMEFTMSRLTGKYPEDIANSDNEKIREFHVDQQYSFEPKQNVSGKWRKASPANIGKFSAVAYYMVKNLYDKYKVPMGVIHTSWGGTPAEAWTSKEGLKDFNNYLEKYNYYKDTANFNATVKQDKQVMDAWYKKINDNDKGFAQDGTTWSNPLYNTTSWRTMKVPGFWENQGAADVDGVVWARKEITLTKAMLGADAILDLGMIDDSDTTYFNGVKVGTTPNKYVQRKYVVPASLLKEGKNVIAVRMIDTDGSGGFIKDKRYRLLIGDDELDLAGDWQYQVGVSVSAMPVNSFTRMYYQPTTLYNAMITPLIPYTIKGAAWYQGESNSGRAYEYRKLLPAMISDWRERWQQGDFPFLIVQLANYMAPKDQPDESNWAELREAQLMTSQQVANSALAVTIDIGEANDVHPLNKKDVGLRLALAAQKLAYNDNEVVYSGPTYTSMKVEGSKIILSFTNIGGGLLAKDGELKQFAIAGNDRKFIWAKAVIEGDKIVVWNDSITNPVAVRYAWAHNPVGCNLYNKENLPASPFRTDDWKKN